MTAQPEPVEDDFFASLDAEIKVHTDKAARKGRAAELKKKSHNRYISREDREKAERQYLALRHEIEMELWKPTTTLALFTEQQCDGCGSVHRLFLQYMEAQVKNDRPNSKRTVRVTRPNMDLPLETMIQAHRTHLCADCCEDHGFSVHFAAVLPVAGIVLSVSPTYTQEDINDSRS